MTGSMAFFWRDIQTVKGACRAALALPHVDIGELRQVERSSAFVAPAEEWPKAMMRKVYEDGIEPATARVTVQMARSAHTKRWQDSPPSIAELFALPILAQVAV
jgi:hypothetical protein